MAANPSAIANLLRLARTECRATVAFAVVATNGQPELLRVPTAGDMGTPSNETLADIVDRAALDPEFGLARAFVRSVQLPSATLLGVAPVAGASRPAMIGVLGDDPSGFGPAQLELLDRLAERIARHIKALHAVERPAAGGAAPDEHPDAHPDEVAPRTAGADLPADAHASEPVIPPAPAVPPAPVVPPAPAAPQPAAVVHQHAQESTMAAAQAAPERDDAHTQPADPGRPSVAYGGFGSEPAGVIAPSEPGPLDPGGHRQPLGPQSLSSTGGFLRASTASPPEGAFVVGHRAEWGDPMGASRQDEPTTPRSWWAASDVVTGLPSLGQFFSRAGRLLGSEARASGAVALVLIEVPDERTALAAARALSAQLRFSDPLARVDRDVFAAAVLLFPGSMRGDAVEERLGAAVRSALDWLAPVRTTHVLAEPGDRRDVDELMRQAMTGLPGRSEAGSLR
jgi:hypothetical protein